ncbi:MAG: caspase family protein [Nostoc sp.]
MARVALLIGVSEYEPGLNPLPSAVKDVEAMRRVLVNPEMGGFDEAEVLKNPLRQEMKNKIYHLYNKNRNQDDVLLLYFSGHGITDSGGEFYFSTAESCKDQQGKLVPMNN